MDSQGIQGQHPLLSEKVCQRLLVSDKGQATSSGTASGSRRKIKTRQVWALFAVGPIAHPQKLHQLCQAPRDTSGTSHGAGVGASSGRG